MRIGPQLWTQTCHLAVSKRKWQNSVSCPFRSGVFHFIPLYSTLFTSLSVSTYLISSHSSVFHFISFSFSLILSYSSIYSIVFHLSKFHSILFPFFFQVSFHLIPISGVFWSFLHLWVTCGCTWLVPYGQSKDLYFPKTVYTQGSPLCQWIISSGYCAELLLWW